MAVSPAVGDRRFVEAVKVEVVAVLAHDDGRHVRRLTCDVLCVGACCSVNRFN